MKWIDVQEIVFALMEKYPDEDVQGIHFVRLHAMVCGLSGFSDDPNRANEKILEAIQSLWLEEIA